jgi:thymidylate synthase
MHIRAETLDDAQRCLLNALLHSEQHVLTSRGDTQELIGVQLELSQPRARLSRSEMRGKPFSCLGELLWYLAGDNSLEFITYYIPRYRKESDDDVTVHGAYGPRLFGLRGHNQINNVIALLRERPNTRRAAIQLFDADDLSAPHKEIPCTTTLQFILRAGTLQMVVYMRSNDAYTGLPHDVFCFTMLQEIIARSLEVELGVYRHCAGSMHIYEDDVDSAREYLGEGVQPRIEMPEMPPGDPWPAIEVLKNVEAVVRRGGTMDAADLGLKPYWTDLVRLLQVFAARGDAARIENLKNQMYFQQYSQYVRDRLSKAALRAASRG